MSKGSPLRVWLLTLWKKRYGHVRFHLVDIICIAYLALFGFLMPFFHARNGQWLTDLLIHVGLIVIVFEVLRLHRKHHENKAILTIRSFYPIAFYIYGWSEIGRVANLFYGTFWASDFLLDSNQLFENFIRIRIQQMYSPILDELMSMFYSSYYLFAPVVILPFFIKGKQEEVLASLAIVTLTYFANYILISFFPALSPRLIPDVENLPEYSGYFFASFIKFLQTGNLVPGGCFPSSHVSGAMAWALAGYRYNRTLGYFLIIFAIYVGISTAYLRYHYVLCPVFGFILGFIGYNVAVRILIKRKEISNN